MKDFIWVGPSGYNPTLGAVKNGGKVSLDEKTASDFLDRKLIKEQPAKKTKIKE